MKYNSEIHNRKTIRLNGYDYSQAGLYFITICCQNWECLFGEIVNGEMICNDAGKMVENEWLQLPQRFNKIKLHEYVLMPNHFHGIIEIITVGATLVVAQNDVVVKLEKGQPQGIAPTDKTVGDMVGAFKSITTIEYIKMAKQQILPQFNQRIWQRNYWEHIVRDENEYQCISEYIINNPMKWDMDKLNNNGTGCSNEEVWMI